MTTLEARLAAEELLAEYAHLLDEDRLEDWLELFCDEAAYRIVTRENFDLGLPQPLMLCENKAMLRDRVVSLRNANIYNVHRDRHLIGSLRVAAEADGRLAVESSFAVYQTDGEGESRLFGVGSYRDVLVRRDRRLLFADKLVLLDTAAVPTLLSTPL